MTSSLKLLTFQYLRTLGVKLDQVNVPHELVEEYKTIYAYTVNFTRERMRRIMDGTVGFGYAA